MNSKPVLVEEKNKIEILEEGKVLGTITKIKQNDYSWVSNVAKRPYHQGRCKTEAEALAHLGFKRNTPV